MYGRRYRPEDRARFVTAFRASGLKQKEFAAREGITVSALQNWLYSKKGVVAPEPATGGFVRVVGAKSSPRGGVTVQVGGAAAISFDSLPDPKYLASLARALAC